MILNSILIFLFRVILAAVIAILISYSFFSELRVLKTLMIAMIMLLLAYIFEYIGKKGSRG